MRLQSFAIKNLTIPSMSLSLEVMSTTVWLKQWLENPKKQMVIDMAMSFFVHTLPLISGTKSSRLIEKRQKRSRSGASAPWPRVKSSHRGVLCLAVQCVSVIAIWRKRCKYSDKVSALVCPAVRIKSKPIWKHCSFFLPPRRSWVFPISLSNYSQDGLQIGNLSKRLLLD